MVVWCRWITRGFQRTKSHVKLIASGRSHEVHQQKVQTSIFKLMTVCFISARIGYPVSTSFQLSLAAHHCVEPPASPGSERPSFPVIDVLKHIGELPSESRCHQSNQKRCNNACLGIQLVTHHLTHPVRFESHTPMSRTVRSFLISCTRSLIQVPECSWNTRT